MCVRERVRKRERGERERGVALCGSVVTAEGKPAGQICVYA